MPLISVIVPVYAVQGYLRPCLDSILDQTGTDIEVIAVDDCSPDHCPAVLDEYAARDARLRVLHLDTNVGLGRARNAGLDQARGQYVWFVDSDDWLAPGSLRAVAAKLRQTQPDVLVVDHTRVSWLGSHRLSDGRRLLRELDGAECATLREETRLLGLLHVAWNKVVRRGFLTSAAIRFDTGWYEDVPFTFPLLVAADRIATLGRVCYHYRRRRQDAITTTRSQRHFEVFDQWARVSERLDAMPERSAPFRQEIFRRMMWHLLVVQSSASRLPPQCRPDFFARLSQYYHRYRPAQTADTTAPRLARYDVVRHRLVASNAYRSFRSLRAVRIGVQRSRRRALRAVRRVRAAGRRMARGVWTAIGLAWYAVQRRLPLDRRLALFAAYWYRGFACNPAAIYRKTREIAPAVKATWIVNRRHAATMPPGVPYVVAGTPRYYRALARARWLINNVNFPDHLVKRRGSTHVQTHHGTPVKVMGLDQRDFPVGAQGLDLPSLMRRCDRWDYSITANAHSSQVWARCYPNGYETLEYGYPRNDRLATATASDITAARAHLDLAPQAHVALFAPTHREYVSTFRPQVELDELADALGADSALLVRAHYFYPGGWRGSHPAVRDVSAHPCVEDLLLAADVLITDYSSVMFDYAVLDRPIVIFAPDWETYRHTRGVTFDLLAQAPGVVATSAPELFAVLSDGTASGAAASAARARFRARFCYLDDGNAADRVVRHVFAEVLSDAIVEAAVAAARDAGAPGAWDGGQRSEPGHAPELAVPSVAEAGHDERPVVETLVDGGRDEAHR
jgi:CDP-glycerol glycerophosphotransferase